MNPDQVMNPFMNYELGPGLGLNLDTVTNQTP
jgi:hypothetical protein